MPTIFLCAVSGLLTFEWELERGDWFIWTALTIIVLFETVVLMLSPPTDFERDGYDFQHRP